MRMKLQSLDDGFALFLSWPSLFIKLTDFSNLKVIIDRKLFITDNTVHFKLLEMVIGHQLVLE
jgi:hypothetical protein